MRRYRAKRRFKKRRFTGRRRFSMRRAMLRRHPKPEIKWRAIEVNQVIAANTFATLGLIPLVWTQGDLNGNFIGRQIRARNLSMNMVIGSQQNAGASVGDYAIVRISILGYRANKEAVDAHITALGDTGVWDFNLVHVYYDQLHRFNNADANPGGKQSTTIKKCIRFPRKIQLSTDPTDGLQDDRDRVVIYVNNTSTNNPGIQVYGWSKLSYIDN